MGILKALANLGSGPVTKAAVDRAVQERLDNIEKARVAGEKARAKAAADARRIHEARNPPRAVGH